MIGRAKVEFAILLGLHAPVLKPDLDLALGQTERVRDFDAPFASQIAVEVELLFKLESLVAGVRLARALMTCAVDVRCYLERKQWLYKMTAINAVYIL